MCQSDYWWTKLSKSTTERTRSDCSRARSFQLFGLQQIQVDPSCELCSERKNINGTRKKNRRTVLPWTFLFDSAMFCR